ncbi:MAG: phage recombination protein Bet [Pseudomonadota bacterium]|nr:phage recombination protein Bet [Pseudomonadota bacterium]
MSETKDLAPYSPAAIDAKTFFSPDQMDLIKKQIAPKATSDELKLFLYQAARTGLDPLSRQIYAIHRNDNGAAKMTIQTSIDGFRLIAERTERYAPGRETTFEYDEEKRVNKATAYVMKQTKDGKWHEVAASAYFLEYAQTTAGGFTKMWKEKPHIMLAKCAEALALRKAFPAEMSGLYTQDEMGKADEPSYTPPKAVATSETPKASPTSAISAAPVAQHETDVASLASMPSADREPGDDEDETDDPNDRVDCLKWEKSSDSWIPAGNEPRRTDAQNRKFHALLRQCRITDEQMHQRIVNLYGKEHSADLSVREMGSLIDKMEQRVSKGHTPDAREAKWKRDGFVKNEATGAWSDPQTGEVAQ